MSNPSQNQPAQNFSPSSQPNAGKVDANKDKAQPIAGKQADSTKDGAYSSSGNKPAQSAPKSSNS